jgi:hypothetical protein
MVACDWAQRTARDRLGADIITLPGKSLAVLTNLRGLAPVIYDLVNC